MPKWIHDRAQRLQSENPDMPESEAWAIATQQSHAGGHTPKGYGTSKGKREAKMKYNAPKGNYQKTAMVAGLLDELEKIAFGTAEAMEAIGIPAAVYMGYRHGGLRGAATSGISAAGGLGAGMAAGHLVKRVTDKSPWMHSHPLVKAVVDAAPVGMGGIIGGTAGEHFAGHHKAASSQIKLSGVVMDYLLKKLNPIVALDAANDLGKLPVRMQEYEQMAKEDQAQQA